MRRKAKAVGHWLFENGFPALFWSGLTVGVNLLLFEKYFEEHSCEEEESYVRDSAKQLFWAVFLTRLIFLPILVEILKRIIPEKLPSQQTVNRLEVELNDGIETGLFVFETIEKFEASLVLGVAISLPALWPIFCAFYKFYDSDFIRGPKGRYKHYEPAKKKWAFIIMECLYNVLSLASATSFLVGLLFNILYDSSHPDLYPQEKRVLLGFMALASVVGAASVRSRRSYKVMCYSEAFINSLYYSLNITVSSAACLYPESFTDAGFLKEGWKYALGFGLLCLGIAGIGGFHGIENPYIPHHDEHEGGRYRIFPLLDDEDQYGSPNQGLRSPYVTYN